jgi:hypothetical protein
MQGEKKDVARLTVEETKAAIHARLARFSPSTPASVLPWKCTQCRDGRINVSFEVAPHSDHFMTLIVAIFEMSKTSSVTNADAIKDRSVSAVVSAWDKETSSTGLHFRLLRGDEEGEQVKITLPWTDFQLPYIEVVSDEGGYTESQASAVARLIYMANASGGASGGFGVGGMPGLFPFSNGLLDMFASPGMLLGDSVRQRKSAGSSAEQVGGRESVIEQLVNMGAQVFNCGKAGAESLPWDFLKGIDHIKQV